MAPPNSGRVFILVTAIAMLSLRYARVASERRFRAAKI
jgi:hypothetical protein